MSKLYVKFFMNLLKFRKDMLTLQQQEKKEEITRYFSQLIFNLKIK